jgi:hypothetical protein
VSIEGVTDLHWVYRRNRPHRSVAAQPWQTFLNSPTERTQMSRNTLVWRPTPPDPPASDFLPDELATLLNTWLHSRDAWPGSTKPGKAEPLHLIADQRTLGFLEGLDAMQVGGAAELVTALIKHQSIDLWWE